jgi:hypothetical protein
MNSMLATLNSREHVRSKAGNWESMSLGPFSSSRGEAAQPPEISRPNVAMGVMLTQESFVRVANVDYVSGYFICFTARPVDIIRQMLSSKEVTLATRNTSDRLGTLHMDRNEVVLLYLQVHFNDFRGSHSPGNESGICQDKITAVDSNACVNGQLAERGYRNHHLELSTLHRE